MLNRRAERRITELKYEYQKVAEILSELLELDEDIKKQISEHIQYYGIGHFLENLDILDFPAEILEKLQVIYLMLRYIEISQASEISQKRGDEQ